MTGKQRRGVRYNRNKRQGTRTPNLGYYLIVTNTQASEKNYFEGLKKSIPDSLKGNLVIIIKKSHTVNLVEKCKEILTKEPQYRIPWIVFDRDKEVDFDKIIENAKRNKIKVAWSNPCIEIWFSSYFGEIPNNIESIKCNKSFKKIYQEKTNNKYKKSDVDIYNKLNKYGDEEEALKISEQRFRNQLKIKPSEMYSTTTLYMLVGEIKGKINNNK